MDKLTPSASGTIALVSTSSLHSVLLLLLLYLIEDLICYSKVLYLMEEKMFQRLATLAAQCYACATPSAMLILTKTTEGLPLKHGQALGGRLTYHIALDVDFL